MFLGVCVCSAIKHSLLLVVAQTKLNSGVDGAVIGVGSGIGVCMSG